MQGKNIYKPLLFKLNKVETESPLIKTFFMTPEIPFDFKTGQFVEVTVDGVGEAPYTPSSSAWVKDKMEITIMKAGYVTQKMHELKGGKVLGIRGPFGRGYPLEKFHGKDVIILGGGVGIAPLRCLLLTMLQEEDKFKKIHICFGAKTPSDFIYKDWFKDLAAHKRVELLRTVDKADGDWKETEGVVTVLLDKLQVDFKEAVAVVCGPPIMMKFGTLRLLELGVQEENVYLSMEKNMSCGLGKCGHCAMGDYFVCKDGPVFTYNEIKNHPNIWM
ncbi:MAG: FAD/NAD(P)-binding protein [Candidatus Cloacimonadales bacterium]|nr:FAD/NAD(P)-binding protein [Candidatus Cloacimonadales bacterium]